MAATRLIALHINKGKTISSTLSDRTDYAKNPEKTEKGDLVSAYQCDPFTVDEDFLLSKRKYDQSVGRQQNRNVIAYQIRQSFKPGEITPEKANQVGYELAMRFTKGKYAFIVATHTDRAHIHNHVIFNSTAIDGSRKFRDFWFSGLSLQKLSDIICLENGLSIIQPKPYHLREKRIEFPKRVRQRDILCETINSVFAKHPKTFDEFLALLQHEGYEIKRSKVISVKGPSQKKYIRLDSLPKEYCEDTIRKLFENENWQISNPFEKHRRPGDIVLMQNEILMKGPAYIRMTSKFNIKQIASTIQYASVHNIHDLAEYQEHADKLAAQKDKLLQSVRDSEARLAEIAAMKKHIINYSKTRTIYEAYRKAGYSKRFPAEHREDIELHKASKAAFDKYSGTKIPTVKDLNVEYLQILSQKKTDYAAYRKISAEANEALIHKRNYAAMVGLHENITSTPEVSHEDNHSTR